jgi:hypothetical protein
MAFLLPRLAPPKKRKGPLKRCRGCGLFGTKGFTQGPGWGEWYHVGCFSKAKFVSCAACETVIDEDYADDSVFDDRLLCRTCYNEEEEEYEALQPKCIMPHCDRTAVDEVKPGHWFCIKHVPIGPCFLITSNGPHIY